MINIHYESDKVKVELHENLIFQNIPEFQARLLEVLESPQGNQPLVLDLSAVSMVDSMGLKLIVGLVKTCQDQSRKLTLCQVDSSVAQVFKLCGLQDYFILELKETVEE